MEMDHSVHDAVEDQRKRLEDNVERLRRSLQHWQTWEAEYEGLKEETSSLPPDASPKDLVSSGEIVIHCRENTEVEAAHPWEKL